MATEKEPTRRPRPSRAADFHCRHHWLIEPPDGPTSEGVCKLCGARREFRTSSDDYIREDTTAPALA